MARPVHFEIQASDPQQLIEFYSHVFGWMFNKWDSADYWLINTGPDDEPGIHGGLLPRRGDVPQEMAAMNAFVVTVDVDNIDVLLDRATQCGGTIAVPKMAVPGVGWLAYVKDPDGNIFGMMQADTHAA